MMAPLRTKGLAVRAATCMHLDFSVWNTYRQIYRTMSVTTQITRTPISAYNRRFYNKAMHMLFLNTPLEARYVKIHNSRPLHGEINIETVRSIWPRKGQISHIHKITTPIELDKRDHAGLGQY